MVHLSGGAGRVLVGHQVAAVLGPWSISYNEAAALSERSGSGQAALISTDGYWSLLPPTSLELRLGPTQWLWSNVSVQRRFNMIAFTVTGDPEIRSYEEHNATSKV